MLQKITKKQKGYFYLHPKSKVYFKPLQIVLEKKRRNFTEAEKGTV